MPDSRRSGKGTVLAFDFGERRIGIAVGEQQLGQAHPLTTVHAASTSERMVAIAPLISEWQPCRLVVGRPVALDGSIHRMTGQAVRFAEELRRRFALPVDFAEERLSSVAAAETLHAAGHDSRSARRHLDAVAAQLILQDHFDGMTETAQQTDQGQAPTADEIQARDPP